MHRFSYILCLYSISTCEKSYQQWDFCKRSLDFRQRFKHLSHISLKIVWIIEYIDVSEYFEVDLELGITICIKCTPRDGLQDFKKLIESVRSRWNLPLMNAIIQFKDQSKSHISVNELRKHYFGTNFWNDKMDIAPQGSP